ncbi:hypothetical protein FA13DRAFT_1751276 [Coprinellus micaceus]|uniref:EF-hand domain-containing protein n=1 Tax=Coprinellus micaceus TaxID=71717 RepID=A0A4Y7TXK0_COPMI|nr:hypothetical protein FA13DRAFT_1751276 [Coprinellus micaceus]
MLKPIAFSLLVLIELALAHGGHGHDGPEAGETIQQYAQRHMSKEHHIDSFDARSFFQLHDLDRDGFWNKEEIEAIYGVHHVYSQKKSKDDVEHQKKADHIVSVVLEKLDLNKDGLVSPEELEKIGLDGLPNFEDLGAEGHHYDVRAEFHSTPETQTDESYNHPEDLEHFAHHEHIEHQEAEKEASYQGISVETHQGPTVSAAPAKPGVTRVPPPEKLDPSIKYADARRRLLPTLLGEWRSRVQGPAQPEEKMRRGLPYKYKFRRNWGDF